MSISGNFFLGREPIRKIAPFRFLHKKAMEACHRILDEPTAALSIKETNKVLDYVLQAREKGLSVIYITHNIYHVFPIANRFTILDRGVKLGDFNKADISPEKIIEIISKTKA